MECPPAGTGLLHRLGFDPGDESADCLDGPCPGKLVAVDKEVWNASDAMSGAGRDVPVNRHRDVLMCLERQQLQMPRRHSIDRTVVLAVVDAFTAVGHAHFYRTLAGRAFVVGSFERDRVDAAVAAPIAFGANPSR